MSISTKLIAKASDPNFLLHRYIESQDIFRFLKVTRDVHRQSTFITDEHLPTGLEHFEIKKSDVPSHQIASSPLHFIFHSAYCCSTMLARAFDIEGKSMGLKEPVVLNDLVGWRRRGANKEHLTEVLKQSLALLSKPFEPDETTVIKPSNTCNILAPDILNIYPQAKAILLYAPIESFLQSIVKKEMWGRIWVRKALIGQLKDNIVIGGYSLEDILELTDLQIAALGWLSQYALFQHIIKTHKRDRVKLLKSDTLLSDQKKTMSAAIKHYDLDISPEGLDEILRGPAFTTHSKHNIQFNPEARAKEQLAMSEIHGAEIDMVCAWIVEVAKSQNVNLNNNEANLLY